MMEARSWVRVLSTSRFLAVVEGWGPSQPPSEAVRLLDFLIVEGGEDREPRPWPEPSPVPHPIALSDSKAQSLMALGGYWFKGPYCLGGEPS